jgi:hypothetical protein
VRTLLQIPGRVIRTDTPEMTALDTLRGENGSRRPAHVVTAALMAATGAAAAVAVVPENYTMQYTRDVLSLQMLEHARSGDLLSDLCKQEAWARHKSIANETRRRQNAANNTAWKEGTNIMRFARKGIKKQNNNAKCGKRRNLSAFPLVQDRELGRACEQKCACDVNSHLFTPRRKVIVLRRFTMDRPQTRSEHIIICGSPCIFN